MRLLSLLRGLRSVLSGLGRVLDATRRTLANVLLLAVLAGLLAWFATRGAAPVQEKTTLVLSLPGAVLDQGVDARTGGTLSTLRGVAGGVPGVTRLRDVIAVLEAAGRDDQVTQLLLMPDELTGGGPAAMREVAAAITRFKAGGKKVVAWASDYDQRQYFLAAHADEIWLDPMGAVYIEGYGQRRSYYKEALDRLGVRVDVIRAGAYKSAYEPFSAVAPSAESAEADRALYGSLWKSWTTGVEKARKLQAGAVGAYVDGLPGSLQALGGDAAGLALKAKLVDALKTREQLREVMSERGARDEKAKTFRQVSFGEYLARLPAPARGDAIGVVVAQGEIRDGRAGAGRIGGLSTAELIRRAREDTQIKAVVLRVNSPGGSAFASELVRRELELTRKAGKPVVVSMGDVAASGGYWISTAADEIIADEATLTGSIGVISMVPSAQAAVEKFGVHSGGTTTTWLAGARDWRRDPDPRFVTLLQSVINHTYAEFLERVAAQRKVPVTQIQAVAQGRVWSGADAKAHGLVDRLGSYGDALEAAATRAGLQKGAPVRYFEVQPGRLQRLLQSAGFAQSDADALAHWLGATPELPPAVQAAGVAGALATEEFGWLAEAALQRKPFAAAAHCLCAAP